MHQSDREGQEGPADLIIPAGYPHGYIQDEDEDEDGGKDEDQDAAGTSLRALASRLSPRELVFAEAYVGECRFNATKAAKVAGYADNQHTNALACRVRQRPRVAAYIDALVRAASPPVHAILAELADVGFSEFRDHIEIVRDPRTQEVVRVRMDLRSKVEALHILAKANKLLTERIEQETRAEVLVREYPEGV